MPKEAARLFLEITDRRVERVSDITEEDAVAEGIYIQSSGYYCWHADYALNDSACNAKTAYKKLYQSIPSEPASHGREGCLTATASMKGRRRWQYISDTMSKQLSQKRVIQGLTTVNK